MSSQREEWHRGRRRTRKLSEAEISKEAGGATLKNHIRGVQEGRWLEWPMVRGKMGREDAEALRSGRQTTEIQLQNQSPVSALSPLLLLLPRQNPIRYHGTGGNQSILTQQPLGLLLPRQGEDGQACSPHFPANTVGYI